MAGSLGMVGEKIGYDTQSHMSPDPSLPAVVHRADIHHMREAAEGSLDQVQVPVAGSYRGCRQRELIGLKEVLPIKAGFFPDLAPVGPKPPCTLPHPSRLPKFSGFSNEERMVFIRRDSRYAHVVCRCETVTEGELVEAIRRGARTVGGVKYRTRAEMGRCQGVFYGRWVARFD